MRRLRWARRLIPIRLKAAAIRAARRQILGYDEALPSFSHCGEDRILAYLFRHRRSGFYVDVGAYHPVESSNTYWFYLQGWRGINIDAFPGSMQAFRQLRPRDTNVEVAIAAEDGEMTYYQIGTGHHQMNGFSLEFQSRLWEDYGIREEDVRRIPVRTQPLRRLLAAHVPPAQHIDFLCVDVEGLEQSVLASNDWEAFRPDVVMVEHHGEMSPEIFDSNLATYMHSQRYRLIGKTPNELIYLAGERSLSKSGSLAP